MIVNGVDNVDIDSLYPGDNIKLKIVSSEVITKLLKQAEHMGCKLIMLNYGEFYLKEFRSGEREEIIDNLLSE